MNLDFLDVLAKPMQKTMGTVGTTGTRGSHAGLSVPEAVYEDGNNGNKLLGPAAGADACSQVFPTCSQALGTEIPNVCATVPNVPCVPRENEQACNDADAGSRVRKEAAAIQLPRWLRARCISSRQAWGSEKFLYSDYSAWCQQYHQASCSQALFSTILSESFQRDGNGWQGLCLAVDFAAGKAIVSKPICPLPLATTRVQ